MLFFSPMLSGILKVGCDDMRLWKDGLIMEDAKTLSDSGVTVHNAQVSSIIYYYLNYLLLTIYLTHLSVVHCDPTVAELSVL